MDAVGRLVSLREVTGATLIPILKLAVTPAQQRFVAPNAFSIAQAHFEPKAWFRAIYADDEPVGFLMLHDDADAHEYFLWRLMVDAAHQGQGYGRRAVELLIDYVRTRPHADALLVSAVPGEGSPIGFYQSLGFVLTGEVLEGEEVLRLPLESRAA